MFIVLLFNYLLAFSNLFEGYSESFLGSFFTVFNCLELMKNIYILQHLYSLRVRETL